MDVLIDEFWKGQTTGQQKFAVSGYFVRSTAPINMEDDERQTDETLPTIYDVVESLYQNSSLNASYTGLVIQTHGYNTGVGIVREGQDYDYTSIQNGKRVGIVDYVYKGWKDIHKYINETDLAIFSIPNSFVYIGYRWASESVPSNPSDALRALPFPLRLLFGVGLGFTFIGFLLLILFTSAIFDALFTLLVIVGSALMMLVGSLFILRIIVYFRDSYRANNFGVPDLVEFVRQLDQGLLKRTINAAFFDKVHQTVSKGEQIDSQLLSTAIRKIWEQIEDQKELMSKQDDARYLNSISSLKRSGLATLSDALLLRIYHALITIDRSNYTSEDYSKAQAYWDTPQKRIRLTFVGHSMGAFVTTQAVRILSDVFDPSSIGNVNTSNKLPSSNIGRVFSLGRLILTAPDIPAKTITSGRTNFLRSSLRRFEEAYLFSNEGDLALRLASTAANYFSFPASTRTQGYRLGNVTINLKDRNAYGIINLEKLLQGQINHLLEYIGIEVFNRKDRGLEPTSRHGIQKDPESIAAAQVDPESIADLFTYFDCTEYRDRTDYDDRKNKPMNVLICEKQRSPLSLWDYIWLLKAYIDFSGNSKKGIDVHGGYFYGQFSKLLIYRLAFLGFQGLLDTLLIELSNESVHKALPANLQEQTAKITELNQRNQRQLALEYLSWQCEQKRIQVAASSERYLVDIQGHDRSRVRTGILTQEKKAAEEQSSDLAQISPKSSLV